MLRLLACFFLTAILFLAANSVPPVTAETQDEIGTLFLRRAEGNLAVNGSCMGSTFEVYFHVPVPHIEQFPLFLEINCPELVNFRYLKLNSPNLLVVAELQRCDNTILNWKSWVLCGDDSYEDLPANVPIPTLEDLPDSVLPWLQPTDCVQFLDSRIQATAQSLLPGTGNLMHLAERVATYCGNIPYGFGPIPYAFDAVYTQLWNNSCTGHAHLGAALFRALGVPSRCLLYMMAPSTEAYDMHWVIEYFVPEYGWVRLESTTGEYPLWPRKGVVISALNPEDEFPVYFPVGIDAHWHSSEYYMSVGNPAWSRAHRAFIDDSMAGNAEDVAAAKTLSREVFAQYCKYQGTLLTPADSLVFQSALGHQEAALSWAQGGRFNNFHTEIQLAMSDYSAMEGGPESVRFFDDLEDGSGQWSHGGDHDDWMCGAPTYGPNPTHSGSSCWATNLNGQYQANADSWLEMPPIDLTGLATADLQFWVWNRVQDRQGEIYDPLWVEIKRPDFYRWLSLSSSMGGTNDNPLIPQTGGWNYQVLSLDKYLGQEVRIRFRFRSDDTNQQLGVYLDDVSVVGRILDDEVPVAPGWVCDFSADFVEGQVDLSWTVVPEAPALEFQLQGTQGLDAWTVAHTALPGRQYQAVDSLHPAGESDAVNYRLLGRTGDSGWLDLAETELVGSENPEQGFGLRVFPNPSNPQTNFHFGLLEAGLVRLRVFDLRGRCQATLHEGRLAGGPHSFSWAGTGPNNQLVSTGIYFVRLETDQGVQTQKITLVR